MVHLFRQNKQVNTIKVHRSSISSALKLISPPTPIQEDTINNLLKAMAVQRPRTVNPLPKWRPSVVLNAFLEPPFAIDGSDRNISLELLTYKTAFLVSLASAARGSELVALSRADHNLNFTSDSSGARHVSIKMVPKFMPKNALPNTIPEPIKFPGIAHLFPKEPERLLCPVRVLGLYVNRTQQLADQAGTDRLFVHFQPHIQVFTSHFRLWVAEAIERAYDKVPLQGPNRVNAHEVRAVASSISYFKKTPLDQIRDHIGWRSKDVFSRHYLRDMGVDEDLEGLPLVAAGSAFV